MAERPLWALRHFLPAFGQGRFGTDTTWGKRSRTVEYHKKTGDIPSDKPADRRYNSPAAAA
jgi:hypothetical protein